MQEPETDHRQPALRSFFVLRLHICAGLPHGENNLIERNFVRAIALHRHARGVDRLDRAHGIALDARNLHQAADGIACQAEIVLHADLGGVFDLLVRAFQSRHQARGGHGAGDTDFALATDFCA